MNMQIMWYGVVRVGTKKRTGWHQEVRSTVKFTVQCLHQLIKIKRNQLLSFPGSLKYSDLTCFTIYINLPLSFIFDSSLKLNDNKVYSSFISI